MDNKMPPQTEDSPIGTNNQLKKKYSTPKLIIIDTKSIAGGVNNMSESNGGALNVS